MIKKTYMCEPLNCKTPFHSYFFLIHCTFVTVLDSGLARGRQFYFLVYWVDPTPATAMASRRMKAILFQKMMFWCITHWIWKYLSKCILMPTYHYQPTVWPSKDWHIYCCCYHCWISFGATQLWLSMDCNDSINVKTYIPHTKDLSLDWFSKSKKNVRKSVKHQNCCPPVRFCSRKVQNLQNYLELVHLHLHLHFEN